MSVVMSRPHSRLLRPRSTLHSVYESDLGPHLDPHLGPPNMSSSLAQQPPRDVAAELGAMDAELLRKISPSELEGGAWMKADKMTRAPNIMAMIYASNALAQLVPTEVLKESTIPAMAHCISAFIKIASKCHRMHNYNSLKAILAGLQCTPLYRLKSTWKEVPTKRKKRFEYLSKLMCEDRNWAVYRQTLKHLLESTTPCVPFLGVLLTSTVQYQNRLEGRPRKESGVEDYTLLDAVTVRKRLESLKCRRSTNGYTLAVWKEKVDPTPLLDTMKILRDSTESLLSCDSTPPIHHGLTRAWSELDILNTMHNDGVNIKLTRSCCDLTLGHVQITRHSSLKSSSLSSLSLSPTTPLPGTSLTHPIPPLTPLPVTPSIPVTLSPSISPRTRKRSDCMSESRSRQFSVEVPPEVLMRRRRASTLLGPLHGYLHIPSEQLSCYQILSLGVSGHPVTNSHIRNLITHSHRNTESVNYKLSYLREP